MGTGLGPFGLPTYGRRCYWGLRGRQSDPSSRAEPDPVACAQGARALCPGPLPSRLDLPWLGVPPSLSLCLFKEMWSEVRGADPQLPACPWPLGVPSPPPPRPHRLPTLPTSPALIAQLPPVALCSSSARTLGPSSSLETWFPTWTWFSSTAFTEHLPCAGHIAKAEDAAVRVGGLPAVWARGL